MACQKYVFTYFVHESKIFLSKNNFMVYFSTFEQKFYSFNLIVIYRTRAQVHIILPTSKKLATLIRYCGTVPVLPVWYIIVCTGTLVPVR